MEISKLTAKEVIKKAQSDITQFVCSVFLRPKKDGSYCRILNLNKFNESVGYHHFKMDCINIITKLVTKNCYKASLDIKDAYYSIPNESLPTNSLAYPGPD